MDVDIFSTAADEALDSMMGCANPPVKLELRDARKEVHDWLLNRFKNLGFGPSNCPMVIKTQDLSCGLESFSIEAVCEYESGWRASLLLEDESCNPTICVVADGLLSGEVVKTLHTFPVKRDGAVIITNLSRYGSLHINNLSKQQTPRGVLTPPILRYGNSITVVYPDKMLVALEVAVSNVKSPNRCKPVRSRTSGVYACRYTKQGSQPPSSGTAS